MKKFVFISLVLLVSISLFGCGKKETGLEEISQEAVTMDALTGSTANVPSAESVSGTPITKQAQTLQNPVASLEPLPPQGPYKPAPMEIQTALKNAGFYAGTVDGKIGPKSKKAIEEFQKANNLKVDGKVGPKTWAALSKYLNVQAPAAGAISN